MREETSTLSYESNLSPEEERFLNDGCGCSMKCTKQFKREDILHSHWDCLELNYSCSSHINHQSLMIRGVLHANTHSGTTTDKEGHIPKQRQKTYTNFQFHGKTVCRKFFQFMAVGVWH